MKKPIIVLTGPTAVGKTEISIELAKAAGGEIISADSMQVYKQMDIGTAKIKKEQMQGVTHYMIDEWNPDEEFNVMIFQKCVKEIMEDIYNRGKIPILVGGTGFYIQAVLNDIAFTKEKQGDEIRADLQNLAKEKGASYLHHELQKVDKESAEAIHPNNIKRVIRALEYFQSTGQKFSDHNKEERQKGSPYNFLYLVLTMNREVLYERIDKRVDQMMEEGLVKEVKELLDAGYSRNLVSMQGLGYKEFFDYFDGEMSLEETVDKVKRDTRRFAKRQLTWFRREKEVVWLNKKEYEQEKNLLDSVLNIIKEKGICNGTKR